MKKFVVALFAGLLILATAAPLFAETYIDGQVFYRPRIYWNNDFLGNNKSTNDARILPILWLGAGYKAEDYAEAYFRLYTLGAGAKLGDSSYGGTQPGGSSENRHTPSFTNAWFDVKVPGTPVHWRVGRFNQSLGHGFYMNTGGYGGDGMKLWAPIGPVRVDLGYMKMGDLGDFSRDIDQYFLQASAPVAAGHSVSGAFMYFNGQNLNIVDNHSSRAGSVSHMMGIWDPSIKFDSNIWTLGLAADGAFAAGGDITLTYRAEAVYAGGCWQQDFEDTDFGPTTQEEAKINAFAILGGITANFGGVATMTLEGAYGSGDHSGKVEGDNWGQGDTYEGFHIPMAQWGRSVWFDEYSFYADTSTRSLGTSGDPFEFAGPFGNGQVGIDRNAAGQPTSIRKMTGAWNQRGLENLIYVTLGGTYTPLPPLTLGLDIFKFWASQVTHEGGFDPNSRIVYSKEQDSDIGWEIDLTAKWTFNKNFAVTGAFAPFIPGDWFKVPAGSYWIEDPTNDPNEKTPIEADSSLSWGYVARANCVFTF
jgi:hypothetical protein